MKTTNRKIFKGYEKCIKKVLNIFIYLAIDIQKVIHLEFWQR